MRSAIVVEDLSKRFRLYSGQASSLKEAVTKRRRSSRREFWALRDVNLEIPEGSMYALIGHNGSGKSTLLRCIAGIYQPTTGVVHSSGRISALLELGSGFHPDLTGRENVYLNAAIIGLSRKEIDDVFDEVVAFAGVEDFIDTPIRHYSSGMYVRLGFSVAVHVDPEILIIDEVITVGDEEFQRRCYDHLYELRRRGVTIVVVSHSLGLVQAMCDEVAWLDHGEVQQSGRAVEVVGAYLKRVNEAERAAHAGEGAQRAGDHFGTGEVVISEIEYLDGDGTRVSSATSGEPIRIRMHYQVNEPVDDPVFAVSIRSENGTVVGTATTAVDEVVTGPCRSDGHVDWVIDPLPILAGTYDVYTSIYDRHSQHAYFHQDGGFRFPVRAGRRPLTAGLVDLGARWELP